MDKPMVLACNAVHRHDPFPQGECWIPASVDDFNIEAAHDRLVAWGDSITDDPDDYYGSRVALAEVLAAALEDK